MNALKNESHVSPLISIKDVAKEAEVSVTTVSRAINNSGYVSEKSRKKITKAIEKLNFSPNSIARSMVTRRSGFIGIMMPHLNSPVLTGFVAGVESAAGEKGLGMMLCYSNENVKKEEYYLKLMAERRVEGMIIMPAGFNNTHFLNYFKQMPMLFTIRTFENSMISSIVLDDYNNSYKLMEHIIHKGHKKIAIIRGSKGLSTSERRFKGACDAMKDANIELDSDLIKIADNPLMGSKLATVKLLEENRRPTVIYALSYESCIGVCLALKEREMSIPYDISVASFDGFDNSQDEHHLLPAITSNTHPKKEMGKIAFDLLFEQIEARNKGIFDQEPMQYKVSAGLIDRGSVIDIS